VQISCFQCYLRLLFARNFASQCVIIMENYSYTNSEMTDMVFCYGSADGVGLRAQAFYRKKFSARCVLLSQTFLAVVGTASTGKWYFSTDKCGQRPRAYATGVRPRTPNSRNCGRKPVNQYPAVSS
jgi:hypothetical protein